MDETLTIGIAFRGHRDRIPLHRDNVPLYRDGIPPLTLKPAPILAFCVVNSPLPYFYHLSTKAAVENLPEFHSPRQARGTLRVLLASNFYGMNCSGTPRKQVHEPQRGKPRASRISLAAPSACNARTGVAIAPSVRTIQLRKTFKSVYQREKK